VLEPLGLAWWAIDSETIQITSREKLAGMSRLEFHAVPKAFCDQFASPSAMVESLRGELSKSTQGEGSSTPQAELAVDPVSGRLIVLANAGGQRFLTQRLKVE
jgi:hypothetical protein